MPGLRDLIDGWSNGRAVRGAAMISEDGLMVHQTLAAVADGEAVAALAVSLLRSGGQLGEAGRSGAVRTVVLDLTGGPAIIAPVDDRHTLIVFAKANIDIGPLLHEIGLQREAVSAAI